MKTRKPFESSSKGNIFTETLDSTVSSGDSGSLKRAVDDPQGYSAFVNQFSQDKKRVLVESVGEAKNPWDGWRIRRPLDQDTRAFQNTTEVEHAKVEMAAIMATQQVFDARFDDVLSMAGKKYTKTLEFLGPEDVPAPGLCPNCRCGFDADVARATSPAPETVSPSDAQSKLTSDTSAALQEQVIALKRQLKSVQHDLQERDGQLRFVRDVYDRDVLRVKELMYRNGVPSGAGTQPVTLRETGSTSASHRRLPSEGQGDGKPDDVRDAGKTDAESQVDTASAAGTSPGRLVQSVPLVAKALGSTVVAHQFYRMFFGKDDMILIAPEEYRKLKQDVAAAAAAGKSDFSGIELRRLRKEAAELVERHQALSESAVVVAKRADVAEAKLADVEQQLEGVCHVSQTVTVCCSMSCSSGELPVLR